MKLKKYIFVILQTFLALFAFCAETNHVLIKLMEFSFSVRWGAGNLLNMIFPHTIFTGLLALLLLLFIVYAPNVCVKLWEKVFCVLFSGAMIFGHSFYETDSLAPIFSRTICFLTALIILVGFSVLCIYALKWLKIFCSRFMKIDCQEPKLFEKHPFLAPFLVIFICWLPFILLRYPAGIEFDAYYQIEMFLGFVPMSAHWPVFSSVLMGSFVWLGKALFGSYNIGIFFFVLFQSAVSAAILSYTLVSMKKFGVPMAVRAVCLAVYALSTIFAGYLTSVLKDALFAVSVVLFITLLAEEMFLPLCKKRTIFFGITAFFMCLFRNNGIIILLPCLAVWGCCILIFKKKKGVPLMAAMLCAVILYMGYQNLLIPSLGIEKGSAAEALSVPFQQTARYVRDHPADITEEEKEIIDTVLDYDALASLYDPDLSDPVKATYRGDDKALPAYFKVWAVQFCRHPLTYIEATLNNSYGYYYIGAQNTVLYTDTRSSHILQFDEPAFLEMPKDLLFAYVSLMESMPVLMLFASSGAHFWLAVYMFFSACAKKDFRLIFIFLPTLIGMAVCIASPTYTVNGVRYSLPVIYANLFLLSVSLCYRQRMEKNA